MIKNLIIILILTGFLAGCGMMDFNNPVGVLGGGANGYGAGGGGGSSTQYSIVGKWRRDVGSEYYVIYEFKSDNTFIASIYIEGVQQASTTGTYEISGSLLIIHANSYTYTYTYTVSGNNLTLIMEGEVMEFYRVS